MVDVDTTQLCAASEARLLHPHEVGYVCVARATPAQEGSGRKKGGWSQAFYRADAIEEIALAARNQPDVYISQASFVSRRRVVAATSHLRCAFVDLDVYNLGFTPDEAMAASIVRVATEAGLPAPTYVMRSGRGMYAKWVFSEPVASDVLPHWQELQHVLIALYRRLGCDPKVRDAARVLRMLQTINGKCGLPVEVVEGCGKTYTFGELCRAATQIDPQLTATALATKRADPSREVARRQLLQEADAAAGLAALTTYSAVREPTMLLNNSRRMLNWHRFLDLRDLIFARGGIHKGERDVTLFWMLSFLAMAGVVQASNFHEEVGGLLRGFPVGGDFQPQRDGSLSSLMERVKRHCAGETVTFRGFKYSPIYTPRNDTLVQLLQITSDEMRSLRTIIDGREKQRREAERHPERAQRRLERQDARRTAVALAAQGRPVAEIATELGKDRSTVWRWLNAGKDAGQPYVETRGRKPYPRKAQASASAAEPTPSTPNKPPGRTKTRPLPEHLDSQRWQTAPDGPGQPTPAPGHNDADAVRQYLRLREERAAERQAQIAQLRQQMADDARRLQEKAERQIMAKAAAIARRLHDREQATKSTSSAQQHAICPPSHFAGIVRRKAEPDHEQRTRPPGQTQADPARAGPGTGDPASNARAAGPGYSAAAQLSRSGAQPSASFCRNRSVRGATTSLGWRRELGSPQTSSGIPAVSADTRADAAVKQSQPLRRGEPPPEQPWARAGPVAGAVGARAGPA